jgi:hypothetical protein
VLVVEAEAKELEMSVPDVFCEVVPGAALCSAIGLQGAKPSIAYVNG